MLRLAAILAALAAGDTFPEPAPEPGPNATRAACVVAEASARVERRWPACRFRTIEARGFVDGPVPDDVAGVVGSLRRAQTPAEAALTGERWFPVGQVLRPSVRIARTLADGTQLRLLVTSELPRPRPRPAACRTREVREVRSRRSSWLRSALTSCLGGLGLARGPRSSGAAAAAC